MSVRNASRKSISQLASTMPAVPMQPTGNRNYNAYVLKRPKELSKGFQIIVSFDA